MSDHIYRVIIYLKDHPGPNRITTWWMFAYLTSDITGRFNLNARAALFTFIYSPVTSELCTYTTLHVINDLHKWSYTNALVYEWMCVSVCVHVCQIILKYSYYCVSISVDYIHYFLIYMFIYGPLKMCICNTHYLMYSQISL